MLDHVLHDLTVEVEPFATCVVSSGWRLRLPDTRGATLHFVLSGVGQLRIAGFEPLDLSPYTLAVVPDGTGHALQVPPTPLRETRAGPSRADRVTEHVAGPHGDRGLQVACGRVEVHYARAVPLFGLLSRPLVLSFADEPSVRRLFADIVTESHTDALGRTSMLRALMDACLVHLLRRVHDEREGDPVWLDAVTDPRIATALARVLDDPAAPHSVESLGRVAHMSRSAFAGRFTEAVGRPPMEWVRQVRLERAAELLRTTDLDTETIAHRVGFGSRSHFSRTFTSAFGVTPSEQRDGDTRSVPRLPRPA